MTHDDFYTIIDEMRNNLRCAPYNYLETSIDERESYFKGGEYAKNMPREFITIGGRAKKDFLFGSVGLLLVSDRVKNKLEEIKATGVAFVPITIKRKNNKIIDNYFAMLVTGRSKRSYRNLSIPVYFSEPMFYDMKVDFSKTDCEEDYFPPMWHDVGDLFPLESWDGSDIFYGEGSMCTIYITQRVKNAIEKFSGLRIYRCSDFIWPGGSEKLEKGANRFDSNAKLQNNKN